MWRDSSQPSAAMAADARPNTVALVPITRLAWGRLCAPIACATRMVAAMPMPKISPISANSTLLALAVAVSAASPRWRPTQIALIEPLSDCSTLPPRMGSEKTSRVLAMGPCVRSRTPAPCMAAAGRVLRAGADSAPERLPPRGVSAPGAVEAGSLAVASGIRAIVRRAAWLAASAVRQPASVHRRSGDDGQGA